MARDKNVPVSFRIALGQIKRYFGDTVPTKQELNDVSEDIFKNSKIDKKIKIDFVKFIKANVVFSMKKGSLDEERPSYKVGDEVYVAQKSSGKFVPIKAVVTGVDSKHKVYEIEIDGKDAGTFNFDQVYKDKNLDEAVAHLKEYKKLVDSLKKDLVKLNSISNTGKVYTSFVDAGFEYDDYGLKVDSESLSSQITDLKSTLDSLSKMVDSVKN